MSEQTLQIGYPGITGDPASGSEIPVSSDSTPSTQSSLFEGDAAPSSSVGHTVTPMDIPDNLSEPLGPSTQQLVDKLFSFAFDFFIPHTWPKETRHETQRYTYEVSRCWDDTIMIYQDRCYANAYLSLLAAALAVVTEDDDLAYRSRFFQGQAVTELRQRVARLGPQDPITFKAILKLFSSETLVDNTSVARTHLKMLRKLVNGAGGVIMMDTWFREDILSCDCYFALRYDTRPLFPVRQWTPGPLNQPWKARLLALGVAEDHATGVDSQVEDAVMKAVVADLRELFRVHEYTQMHQIAADDQLLRWQQLRKFDCISRIADHHVNLTIYPHLFQRPLTQTYTCMAMALMTNMMLGSPEPVRFGLKLIAGLRSKMQESRAEVDAEDDNQHQYRGLRLWALYVGSLAERVHPVEAEEEGWFAGEFHSHAADTGLESWDGTRKTLRRFLFSVETGSSTTSFSQRSVPIDLVRRRSGGGTVFHDSGNLNYSVIVPNSQSFAFKRSTHAEMVVRALLSSEMKQALNSISERGEGNRLLDTNNLDIRVNDRNDIVMRRSNADGNGNELPWLKISGSAFKLTRGRALHHGTLLYSSPYIDKISDLLRSPGREYIRAKGVESVRSKVANLVFTPDAHHRDQVRKSIMEAVVREFWDMYGAGQPRQPGMNEISLGDAEVYQTPEVAAGVSELDSDAWRFGQTPRFDFDSGVLDGMSVGFQANHGVLEHLTLRDANGGALIHRQKRQSGTEHEGDGLGHQPLDGVRLSDVASWRDLLSVEPAEQKIEKDQEEQGKAKDRAGQYESSPSDRNSDSSSRDIQVPDSLVRRIEAVFPRWRSTE
ncbi:hypothetical protein KCU88_g5704, partial [Aureobasidium melanogenum]